MCVYIYFLFHHSSGKYALKLNVSRWALFRPGSGHAADLHRRKPGHSYRLSWLIMVQSIILYEYYLCISADPGRRKGECVREEEVLPCYYYYYYYYYFYLQQQQQQLPVASIEKRIASFF